ncbi:protein FAM13A-like [Uloborus diversus]|uniref:protein FAM13A-like n=1 Tax=Uloborus diversus TaxID=327109 RepID=UPI00240A7AB2|nr:protein FAM13A-like [Uloborus diversus]XP_054721073.1 protein FAM13A-like [Uloborus diversus]XP_054721074.1 protein FAM13A-like [Uloborus diversus]
MRAPLCSDTADLCPEEQGCLGPNGERSAEIQTIERSLERNNITKTTVFGVCLKNLMGTTPHVAPQVPFILSRLCCYIEKHGLFHERLFLEGDESKEKLKIEFIKSVDAALETDDNVSSAAKLLIIFFEELPEPLIPVPLQQDFIKDMEKLSLKSSEHVSQLKRNVEKLPNDAYDVLKYFSRFLLHVSNHKEINGMSPDNLGLIFGPVMFRLSTNDPVIHLGVQNIVNHFVLDYHAIFEDDLKKEKYENCLQPKTRIQLPCPSSVMPVMPLMPLSVVIPSANSNMNDEKMKKNIPVLLIENNADSLLESPKVNLDSTQIKVVPVTRKRKERRLSGEDLQQRSSSEERPTATSLSLNKIELTRRCNSHEEIIEVLNKANNTEMNPLTPLKFFAQASNLDSTSAENEKNHSPHPPYAKRREMEPTIDKSDIEMLPVPWQKSCLSNISADASFVEKSQHSVRLENNSTQNSVAEFDEKCTMECDTSEPFYDKECSSTDVESEFRKSEKVSIPRPASCPLPWHNSDADGSLESENNCLSSSWSLLFEAEDSEPMRSEQHLRWPLTKEEQEDNALLSPSVQTLRRSNYEAPLSPSAFRSYLSYRSSHLDSSVPPSPPVEQEDFAKKMIEANGVNDSIKKLTKRIHSIKKKVRKFEEKFEAEFGYKPSHAEKANNPETKKLMNDLHKARKELKVLKEESHLEHVSPAADWHAFSVPHILEDATNHVQETCKVKPSIEESFGSTMKFLSDERILANRPEAFEEMTTSQVKDEKIAIQKLLLGFENTHGRPRSKSERETMKPLYGRYRDCKRILGKYGSFQGAIAKNKDLCSDLQPLWEDKEVSFSSPRNDADTQLEDQLIITNEKIAIEKEAAFLEPVSNKEESKSVSSSSLALKYDNSNIHELPLSEMIFQLQQVKSEKRHLRKILREFESEFFKINGRKVQKEDKSPVESLYNEYRLVKARLKLLDALISKHDQHQLM